MALVTMPSVERSPGGTAWKVPLMSPIIKSATGSCLSPPLSPSSDSEGATQQDLVISFLVFSFYFLTFE
jgi:hypothetical protein